MPSRRARARKKTRNLFVNCIQKTLSSPEQITVSEWAEKYRQLDESSSLPGNWKNAITPYLVEIMNCFNDPYIHFINFVKSTQVGGTEALINALGYIITQDPAPAMIVYPTDDLAKDISNDRLKPVFQKTPTIAERYLKTKSSEMNLRFRNMNLYLRSGGSPSKLASKPIRYLFFDEIDKMPGAQKREASPEKLATERTNTFKYSRKIYRCSTPTYRENYIWRFHERAEEQREYFVPCPNCGEFITLQWKQIKFISDSEKKLTNTERASTAMYYCQECGAEIPDNEKPKMLQRGEWRDVKRTCKGKASSVSFHINALYSFFISWSDIALQYLDSRDDPEEYQNFINSWLAEPWEDTKLKVSVELIAERTAQEARGVIPDWAEIVTAGVDVQRNSVYFDIVAWGRRMTSQSIMHGHVLTLDDIIPYMTREYFNSQKESFIVSLCLIDSGDQTDMVYEFCAQNPWAYPSKGYATLRNNYIKLTSINRVGKTYNGQTLILVDTSKYKDLIAAKLHIGNGEGSCMVHADCDDEYAEQLTSEHKVAEGTGARRRLVWRTKTRHTDNHYLDCRVYASAAADTRGVRELDAQGTDDEDTTPSITQTTSNNKYKGWLSGYTN